MPPAAISDNEDGSDVELGNSPPATTKLASREKRKPVSYKEELVDDDVAPEDSNEEEEGEEEDNGDEEEGEEYVVEKIVAHVVKQGKPFFEVKWEGYDDPKDRTWEPEENLRENASGVLTEYLESIGGREALFSQTELALKTKKRGRPSTGTSSASGKRSRKNGDNAADSDTPPRSAKEQHWKPPAGSWEDHIANIDACEDEVTHKLMVYLTWKNGHKTVHDTKVVYQRCPQKMLQFYERHVRIIKAQEEDAPATPDPSHG